MKINTSEIIVNYRRSGDGPPLLFIHGYPLSSELWVPQLEGLKLAADCLAPDLRGHGESEITPPPYTMDQLAGDCKALLDSLEIERPIYLCGLSMGGYVAFAFYRAYPELVRGLILTATRAGADTEEGKKSRDQAAALAQDEGPEAVIEGMLPKMLAPETYQDRPDLVEKARKIMVSTSLEGFVGDLMGMKTRPDSIPTLARIDVPTLILHGAEDQILPLSEAEVMHTAIKDSRLVVLPSSGHLLNLEQADGFNEAVLNFIQEVEG